MTEDELLAGLLDAAAAGGWLVHHDRRSDLARQQGDSGFPDLVMAHPKRHLVLVLECKIASGRFRTGQQEWIDAFSKAGADARIVRPDRYDELVEYLRGYVAAAEGDHAAALEHLLEAEKAEPRRPGLHIQIGEAYLQLKRWADLSDIATKPPWAMGDKEHG